MSMVLRVHIPDQANYRIEAPVGGVGAQRMEVPGGVGAQRMEVPVGGVGVSGGRGRPAEGGAGGRGGRQRMEAPGGGVGVSGWRRRWAGWASADGSARGQG